MSESEDWLVLVLILILAFVAFVFLLPPPEYVVVGEDSTRIRETEIYSCVVVDGEEECELVNRTRERVDSAWGVT